MDWKRILKHLTASPRLARRRFPARTLAAIEAAVGRAELHHRGELRFVVEGALPVASLVAGQTARQRAANLFASLGVWDTEENSGILIYVQLVDRRVEVVADRGIAARVAQQEWEGLCRGMEAAFRLGQWEGGALSAIEQAGALLALHFPSADGEGNELPNTPIIL